VSSSCASPYAKGGPRRVHDEGEIEGKGGVNRPAGQKHLEDRCIPVTTDLPDPHATPHHKAGDKLHSTSIFSLARHHPFLSSLTMEGDRIHDPPRSRHIDGTGEVASYLKPEGTSPQPEHSPPNNQTHR
jgi:hypothetical protein